MVEQQTEEAVVEKCACYHGEPCSDIECNHHPRWQMTRGNCGGCGARNGVLLYRGQCDNCIGDNAAAGYTPPVIAVMHKVGHLVKR